MNVEKQKRAVSRLLDVTEHLARTGKNDHSLSGMSVAFYYIDDLSVIARDLCDKELVYLDDNEEVVSKDAANKVDPDFEVAEAVA